MAEPTDDAPVPKKTKTDEERARLLIEKDSINTRKATDSHVGHFVDFLVSNGHPLLEEILDADLQPFLNSTQKPSQ